MLYLFLRSKKGYTFMELMAVVVILGILVAVAVPIYIGVSKKRKIEDCRMQRQVMSSTVQEAMSGMMDSGKSQDKIPDVGGRTINYKDTDGTEKSFVGKYLLFDNTLTLGIVRGGYRDDGSLPYSTGFDNIDNNGATITNESHYLKKLKLKDRTIISYLSNQELPICPFENDNTSYQYFLDADGNVYCNCYDCLVDAGLVHES